MVVELRTVARDVNCAICMEPLIADPQERLAGHRTGSKTDVAHIFHQRCLNDHFRTSARTCPICRIPLNAETFARMEQLSQRPVRPTNATIHQLIDTYLTAPPHARADFVPIGEWDTSAVTNMSKLFLSRFDFDESINAWDVSNVTDMSRMFRNAYSFNQPLNRWNTAAVTNMNNMFSGAEAFNQDIHSWDVSRVTDMARMFAHAESFHQPIQHWRIAPTCNTANMLVGTPIEDKPDMHPRTANDSVTR